MQFYQETVPTGSLVAWAHVARADTTQHPLLLGRGGLVRYKACQYSVLQACHLDTGDFGEFTITHHNLGGTELYVSNPGAKRRIPPLLCG